MRACRSVDRSSASGAEGRGFKPLHAHPIMSCLFCRIIRKEIPCSLVLETDYAIAFLDINPLSSGHTLVVPKEHAPKMHELSDETLQHCLICCKQVVFKLKQIGMVDYNILQNNGRNAHQEIDHVHFHVIPKFDDGLELKWKTKALDPQILDSLK